jgi:hypothetical protein
MESVSFLHASSIINLTEAAQDAFLQPVQVTSKVIKIARAIYPFTGPAVSREKMEAK